MSPYIALLLLAPLARVAEPSLAPPIQTDTIARTGAHATTAGVSRDSTRDPSRDSLPPSQAPRRPIGSLQLPAIPSRDADSLQGQRPKAIVYSDWYGRRLTIHRLGSYVMLPLFATEYVLGDKLLNGESVTSSTRSMHQTVAGAVAGLFAVNTITGVWNLWDSRHDPAGRTRRIVHTALMLAADAGFVATGMLAEDAGEERSNATTHRNVAVGSMALSTVGGVMMWFWKD